MPPSMFLVIENRTAIYGGRKLANISSMLCSGRVSLLTNLRAVGDNMVCIKRKKADSRSAFRSRFGSAGNLSFGLLELVALSCGTFLRNVKPCGVS